LTGRAYLGSLGKADALVAIVELSVVGAHEDVAEDPQGTNLGREIHAHEARDAEGLAVGDSDLVDVLNTKMINKENKEGY
jgi:hypothetical protein